MRARPWPSLSWCLLTLALGCGASPSPDAGMPDSSRDASIADASRSPTEDGGITDASRGDDASGADATIDDAGRSDAGLRLDCLGDTRPLTVSSGLPFASIRVGTPAATGAFLLDLATTASAIDLAALSPRPVASGCDASRFGERCTFDDLDFFGSWGPVTLITQDLRGLGGGVREAGIVGTDFFSVLAMTLDYERGEVRRARSGELCSDAILRAAGFAALSSAGFYSSDLSRLRPMRDVDASAAAGTRVPNVPTIPVRVAGVLAFAQLDTGFDDTLVPNTLNVNQAFFDAINAADAGALVRDSGSDLSLTTCVVGVSESVEAYRLAAGRSLELIDDADSVALTFRDARIFVKRSPAAARSCGGIGTWSAPAAQLAASLHVAMGQVIFDPYTSRVWAPRR